MVNKEIYRESLKIIGNETLDELQPVIKNTNLKLFNLLKDMMNDFISDVFNKRKDRNEKN